MVNNGQVTGIIKYLTKLTHTVDSFRFRFVNVEVNFITRGKSSRPEIQYDLDITSKQSDIPYIWDFFSCKSKHIIEEGCGMVSLSFDEVFTNLNNIYYNGEKIKRYGGYIPESFVEKVSNDIDQMGPKQIKSHFFCGGEKKELILDVTYKLSDIYIDDGITTDVSVYCSQILVDNEPLENIPQSLAETIIGYISEDDSLRYPLDSIIWDEVTRYMELESCEIWTHTYTYLRNIGDIEVEDTDYIGHSTFSSKMCDFMMGDY
jgi:hypothetical protein